MRKNTPLLIISKLSLNTYTYTRTMFNVVTKVAGLRLRMCYSNHNYILHKTL